MLDFQILFSSKFMQDRHGWPLVHIKLDCLVTAAVARCDDLGIYYYNEHTNGLHRSECSIHNLLISTLRGGVGPAFVKRRDVHPFPLSPI